MRNARIGDSTDGQTTVNWHRSLAGAVRDVEQLIELVQLPSGYHEAACRAAKLFPLMVPQSYLTRMRPGDVRDPLLLQVLPLGAECDHVPGFVSDAVADGRYRVAPGFLHKYPGRALLIATGTCAIHCRYCFRRHYPYGNEPRRVGRLGAGISSHRAGYVVARDHS